MKTTARRLLLPLLIVLCPPGYAAEEPAELIERTVADVLAAYEAGKDRLATDPGLLREIIERHILPHVDFPLMARLVLGKYWRKASDAQREEFIEGFRELLIRTYTTPLAEYSGQKIDFLPYRAGADPNRASVDTAIVPHEGPSIPVSYQLRFQEGDGWKVYDISIDGVSMITNYRSAFSSEIARSGLDAFIASLSEERAGAGAATVE